MVRPKALKKVFRHFNMNIVFGGSLQQNEFNLQGQFEYLKLVVIEKSISRIILAFEKSVSHIPHVDDARLLSFSHACSTSHLWLIWGVAIFIRVGI